MIFFIVYRCVISVYFLLLPKYSIMQHFLWRGKKKLVIHWKYIKMYKISQIFALESGKHAAVG